MTEFPYGKFVHALPEGLVHREQWPEYLVPSDTPEFMHPHKVGTIPAGKRWGIWPLIFERYISDIEPNFSGATAEAKRTFTIIIWRRPSRTDVPKGWYRFSKKPSYLDGFADLSTLHPYYSSWDTSTKRYRNKWIRELKDTIYRIEQISYKEFEQEYLKSSVSKKAGRFQLDILSRMLGNDFNKKFVTLWGARHVASGELRAGMAVVDSPTYASSYYQAGFICPSAGHDPLMIGLMDHWYQHAAAKGIRYLLFGGFWHPGKDPKIWKGYSAFKAKFGLSYILYTPELFRIRFK